MSRNLNLYDSRSGFDCKLYQTPTSDTYRILEGKNRHEIFKRYIEWLKEFRRDGRRRLTQQDLAEIEDHSERVSMFLQWYPDAKWGAI
jgi:hypothetical protein